MNDNERVDEVVNVFKTKMDAPLDLSSYARTMALVANKLDLNLDFQILQPDTVIPGVKVMTPKILMIGNNVFEGGAVGSTPAPPGGPTGEVVTAAHRVTCPHCKKPVALQAINPD